MPTRFRLFIAILSLGITALPFVAGAQSLHISEFMASNKTGLLDSDGDSSDWIEIYNSGSAAVDLVGWYLTDDATNPTKWQFPSVSLATDGYLVVFASDKDRIDPAAELHTNFKLSASGEYLALVRPDGSTVEHHYSPSFPRQVADVSYGLGMSGGENVLLTLGAPLRWKVPTDGSDDVDPGNNPNPWIGTAFDDGSWSTGTVGVGYATGDPGYIDAYDAFIQTDLETELDEVNATLYLRIPFTVADPSAVTSLTLKMRYDDGFVAYLNGQPLPVATSNAPASVNWESTALGDQDDSDAIVYEEFLIADPPLIPGANILAIHALNKSSGSSDLLMQPELVAQAAGLDGGLIYATNPTPGTTNIGSDELGPALDDVTETVAPPATGGSPATIIADATADFSGVQGGAGWSYGYHSGEGAYDPATDFTPFEGGEGQGDWDAATQHWTGYRWDLQTASSAPWTAIASTWSFPNDSSPGPRQAAVRRWLSAVSGPHQIAGSFNNASSSGDGTTGKVFHNGSEIFSTLSDGDTQYFDLGVTLAVGDTVDFYIDAGPGDSDSSDDTYTNFQIRIPGTAGSAISVPVSAAVTPTLNPIASVTLKYRVMFGAEFSVPMSDDGAGDDAAAGDGIYTGTINTAALASGEMLRWRVVATDSSGNTNTAPAFPDPLDSPEYYGTVAANPALASSQLPVIQWFSENPGAAETFDGARGSIYFDGEFYDNIQTDMHGQSTSYFPKPSFDFDFNKGARFRWAPGEKRVKDINLLTNWADKSKLRNTMGYALAALTGEPCHFSKIVRLQRNGHFYSVADMVEDGDDRYLERVDLDGEGALYKMYNELDTTSTGVTKKTRKDEDFSDLQTLIDGLGLNGDAKLQYGYDHVDIPGTINYLASLTLINSNDHGKKNYYLYRDTEGSGEWRPLVWDIDLNLGRNYHSESSEGLQYFNDAFYINGIQNGRVNRLKSLIYDYPELWQMYLRRLKTVTDTIIQAPGTPTPIIETMVESLIDPVDPPGVVSDADLDYALWGTWGNNNEAREEAARIADEFAPAMRTRYFTELAGTLPASQPAQAPVTISMGEFNPASGDQDEEYFTLSHSESYAVDLSGWRIGGAVRMDIPAGTVIPAGMTLYVGRDAVAFRGRTSSPKGGEKRILISGYSGQLSARGETIQLFDPTDALVDALTYTGAPTEMQQWLRVTEIHYHPADPSAAEQAANPSWTASDFEFIELTNTGPSTLDISGARFVTGIDHTFPATTTIPAGESIILVANRPAFEARYRGGTNIEGGYTGQLDNGGEQLKLIDDVGEVVLEFTYDDSWHPLTDGDGYALQVRTPGASVDSWDLATSWAPTTLVHGSPGSTLEPHATTFSIWKENYYSPTDAADDGISGAASDGDGDTKTALMEYATATDPGNADTDNLPTSSIIEVGGIDYFAITYTRQKHAIDLTYHAEIGDSLSDWAAITTVVGAPTDHGDGSETVTLRSDQPASDDLRQFVRLRVVTP